MSSARESCSPSNRIENESFTSITERQLDKGLCAPKCLSDTLQTLSLFAIAKVTLCRVCPRVTVIDEIHASRITAPLAVAVRRLTELLNMPSS